jgi:hypothetical protein
MIRIIAFLLGVAAVLALVMSTGDAQFLSGGQSAGSGGMYPLIQPQGTATPPGPILLTGGTNILTGGSDLLTK